jgi:hypothetical protein
MCACRQQLLCHVFHALLGSLGGGARGDQLNCQTCCSGCAAPHIALQSGSALTCRL